MNDKPFTRPDAFGLTAEDWASFLRDDPKQYTGPALLWWALAGLTIDEGPASMTRGPLPDLLTVLTGDARVLARLAESSHDEALRELAPALDNLHRRIAAAAEMAARFLPREMAEPPEQAPRAGPPPPLPCPSDPTRSCGR